MSKPLLDDPKDGTLFRKDYGEGLKEFPEFMGGLIDDYKRRYPHFVSDFKDALSRKTLSSSLMMFLATFCSTVALGSIASRHTNGHIGLSEYLLMNGVAGMIHALVGCQPLIILRPTGPITLMLAQIYSLSLLLGLNFFTLLAWTGFGVAIWSTLITGFELSRHIAMLTCFAHDVFAVFVSSIYVVDGMTAVIGRLMGSSADYAAPLFAFTIAAALIFISFALSNLRKTPNLFSKYARFLMADYALPLATFLATLLSFFASGTVDVERIKMSDTIEPTLADRSWTVPMFAEGWLAAFFTGIAISIPIAIFFYFDQNFSSLLSQTKEMGLSKGSYYHSSFAWTGVFNFVGPIFGMPFVTGSLPHSPQMVQALTKDPDTKNPDAPAVDENRVAPFLMYFLILISYLSSTGRHVIESIPVSAADGVLIVVGLEGIFATRLWRRLPVLVTPDSECSPEFGDPWAARKFTLLQLSVLAAGWILNFTPLALAFPLVIACLVPIHAYVLPAVFTDEQFATLDGERDHFDAKDNLKSYSAA